MFKRITTALPLVAGLLFSAIATAETATEYLHHLQTRWAEVNYQLKDKPQLKGFTDLIAEANTALDTYPDSAELLTWRGIITSSYAGAKGGLGALSLAKDSRDDLAKAIKINPKALDGSAYTSLGTLYFKVPGWPIGFGDDDKAKDLLTQALKYNPDGIDPNYFYGEYLKEEGRYTEAQTYLQKALAAKDRPGRALADSERRKEIQRSLNEVAKELD